MTRCAFISRAGSVAYVAVTYDENGGNLPSHIDEARVHITETRTKPRTAFSTPNPSER